MNRKRTSHALAALECLPVRAFTKTFAMFLVSSVCVMVALAWSQTSSAQTVPLVFQTTFNCPDWDQTMGLSEAVVCAKGDGIAGSGGWTTPKGSVDQITAAANNPAGGGGKGFRHWVGDGTNSGGGGIDWGWTPTSEMWLRYYIRFQSGFAWGPGDNGGYMKTIYCNSGAPGTFYFGLLYGGVGGHIEQDGTGGTGNHRSGVSWSQWQGGSTGDGQFHALEVHAKMNTTGSSLDGVFEFWLDGNQVYSNSKVHFANTTGAKFTECFTSNHANPQNGGVDVYVDFDDLAVSTTGYIGPTYGTPNPTLGPPPPAKLRVQ